MTKQYTDLNAFKKEILDPVSSSVCAAKWYETTMWLYMGQTASCHHNKFHSIDLDPTDLSSLHNTEQKKQERINMLAGKRDNGCNYCWNTEDNNDISDRIKKSINRYNDTPTKVIASDSPLSVIPIMIEVAFSRMCNLACAYCSPSFSSEWAKDIRENGAYNLKNSPSFNHTMDNEIVGEDNKYVDAFLKWWPDISKEVKYLRFTGGEPLLHTNFWNFLDIINRDGYDGTFMVNTNLIQTDRYINIFIERTKNIERLEVHTSCESNMQHAEYTRDGFDGEVWLRNVHTLLCSAPQLKLTVTTAINNLSVWSFHEYIELIAKLKCEYGAERIQLNTNRVYNPNFMQIQLIPITLRKEITETILHNIHHPELSQDETDQIISFTEFLNTSEFDSYVSRESAERELVTFLEEFDRRRNKDYTLVLDKRFVDWIDTLRTIGIKMI